MSPPKKEPGTKRTRQIRSPEVKAAVAKAYLEGKGNAEEVAKIYGVPATSIYDWARIYKEKGEAGFEPKLRKHVPGEPTPAEKEISREVVETKKAFGWFGVPRITQWLRRAKLLPVTEHQVSKALKEADLVPPKPKKRKRAEVVRRFERSEPNQLWQVDITMWTMAKGQKVYLIAFMDDHSRYVVGWGLYAAQGSSQVLEVLRNAIGQYGHPKEILSDQGRQFFSWRGKCPFQKELIREGIHHVVARSHHPQTLGKVEAFWKHLKDEFLSRVVTGSINDLRERLRFWIDSHYNFQRPHQGIENAVPADRYFKMADQVREVIEKGIAKNAEQLSLGRDPIKPFYLAGRMGDQDVVIQQSGAEVVMNVGNRELEKIRLSEEKTDEKEEPGSESRSGSAGSEGKGPGGPAVALGREDDHRDLPGDGPETPPVLQAGKPDDRGDDPGRAVERRGKAGTEPPLGDGGPGGTQPPAPAGESPDASDAPAHPETLQERPQEAEKRPQAGEAAEGPLGGEAGDGEHSHS